MSLGPTQVKKSRVKELGDDIGDEQESDHLGGRVRSAKVSVVRTIGDTVEHDDVAPTKRPLVSRDPLLNLALARLEAGPHMKVQNPSARRLR